ncbi:MAG: hypothetical protein AB1757_12240 [Acidobacteriota bacterium]
MTTKFVDASTERLTKPADIDIQIAERDGEQFLVIKDQHPLNQTAEYAVEIPASLLPELQRAVEALVQKQPDEERSQSAFERDESIASESLIQFAHDSEAEFARILDFYHIHWQYEPRTFVLERDEAGNVATSFTPDFYLPDHDLYIELTTLKQSLVTKKNRKVRLLREHYPDVNIKLLYASDYHKLLEKFSASGGRR